jgi:mono/diheme cytochrome c family protein
MASGGAGPLFLLTLVAALQTQSPAQSPKRVAAEPDGAGRSPSHPDQPGSDRARPHKLYLAHCVDCHDTDGRGEPVREVLTKIPDFTRPEWHRTRSNERLLRSIWEGKGSMPAMKNKLGDADVMQLVSLVRKFRDGEQLAREDAKNEEKPEDRAEADNGQMVPPVGTHPAQSISRRTIISENSEAASGRKVFQRFCVACHGADGRGTSMRAQFPGIPDFTSPVWQRQRSRPQMSIAILEGKGLSMPTFRGKLNDAELRGLVTYLRMFTPEAISEIDAPSTNFRKRFRQLQEKMEDLNRQAQALLSK